MPEQWNSAETAGAEQASILLVDDTSANLLYLRSILTDPNYNIVTAHSGEEALERLEVTEFAVVMLDVHMPGLSGFETARKIRNHHRSRLTPIIFMTASNGDPSQIEDGYAIGAVDFLVKPLSSIVVQAKISGFVQLFQEQQRTRHEADQLRSLVDGTLEYAIFLLSAEGNVVTWNSGAQRLKGYTAEEIKGHHFSIFYPPEAMERQWPQYELAAARLQGRFEDEGWRVRKDGTQFWANVVITALHDANGSLRGFSKITRDMTERKRAEEGAKSLVEEAAARRVAEENAALIREQRERLHVTLASIGDAVISTDAQGNVEFLNPVAEELVGWSSSEAAGRSLSDVFHIVNETTRLPVENPALRALEIGRIVGLANHTILISRDGTERPINDSAAPIRSVDGKLVGSVLVFRDITDQKLSEAALRESEEKLRLLVDTIPQLAWMARPDGSIFWYNRRWYDYTGTTAEQVEGWGWQDVHDPAKLPKVLSRWRNSIETGEPFEMEFPLKGANGVYREFLTQVNPLRDKDGHVLYWFGTNTDIEGQRESQQALAQSEQRFRQLADAMPQIVWTARPDGSIDYLNRQWDEYTGIPGSSGLMGWAQILHPEDAWPSRQRWEACVRTGTPFEREARLLDRRRQAYRWHLLRAVAVRDENERITRWFGTSTDINAQKHSEETSRYLARVSGVLAGVVDYESTLQKVANLAVPYFADWSSVDVAAEDGSLRRLAVAHQYAEKIKLADSLMRQSPSESSSAVGIHSVMRTGLPEIVTEITDEFLAQTAGDEQQLEILRSLGLKSYICVPLTVAGKTLGVLTFATAESGRQYTEADLNLATDLANRAAVAIENTQLYQSLRDADRRKDEFLATLAHELRNPLAPIRNSLQILKMPQLDLETLEMARDVIERQVHNLVRLVDDLLDVSRVMQGKIELKRKIVELAEVVSRAIETAQPLVDAQQHELTLQMPAESLLVVVDPVRMAQVIGNLLTNAAKYTDLGGRIFLSAERDADIAVLRVRDTGIGMAAEMLPRVFELFMQVDHASTKAQGGLGIGLTLVKNLVEMHGGTVDAHSEGLGLGSEFVVRLPISVNRMEQSIDASGPVSDPRAAAGFRTLIVDDNQDAANSLATLLSIQGHEVQVAYHGVGALEIVKTFTPDLVLMDIGMPGMDGYEVARRLRLQPRLANTVLVALTGWGQHEDRRRTAEAGFNHHLVKPPEPSALEAIVAAIRRPDQQPRQ